MNISDIVTLSDKKEYLVVSKAIDNNLSYYCLVDINDNKNIKYCYRDQDEVVLLKKEELSETVLLKLAKAVMKFDFRKIFQGK